MNSASYEDVAMSNNHFGLRKVNSQSVAVNPHGIHIQMQRNHIEHVNQHKANPWMRITTINSQGKQVNPQSVEVNPQGTYGEHVSPFLFEHDGSTTRGGNTGHVLGNTREQLQVNSQGVQTNLQDVNVQGHHGEHVSHFPFEHGGNSSHNLGNKREQFQSRGPTNPHPAHDPQGANKNQVQTQGNHFNMQGNPQGSSNPLEIDINMQEPMEVADITHFNSHFG